MTPQQSAPDPRWTRAWIAWVVAFFVIEFSALARHRPQDTLSAHVWATFDIPRHHAPTRAIRAHRFALVAFLAWLTGHFLSGDDI